MKISFLVTYYNQREFVRKSLNSILRIEKPIDWEILVGDDGSDDGTIEVVEGYIQQDPEHIHLFIMPREKGKRYAPVQRVSANRLHLLEQCTGDCICILDGDDFYCDTKFVIEAVNLLESDSGIAVVAFGFQYYVNGRLGKKYLISNRKKIVKCRDYIRNRYIHAGACVLRKTDKTFDVQKLKKIGSFDDNDILLSALKGGALVSFPKAIYAYRQTGESVYTAMDDIEKAVLNIQGMDADILIMGNQWKWDLYSRNTVSLLLVFFMRHHIKEILGEEKYDRYRMGCVRTKSSICDKLLAYYSLKKDEKDRISRAIRNVVIRNPWRASLGVYYYIRERIVP